MAETGYNWSDAWAFVQLSAGDWDGDASADDAIQTSDAISLDGKAACIIGVTIDEPDNDAVTANSVTIAILGDAGDAYENVLALAGAGLGNPMQFKVTPVQNLDVFVLFSVDPRDYDDFKVCIMNESGHNLVLTVQIKYGTIPVAS
jgi:hypothetical protein